MRALNLNRCCVFCLSVWGRREKTFLEQLTRGVHFLAWDWWWPCTCEDAPCYRTELPGYPPFRRKRILLANCPCEAETVNSQVRPVTLQVGPCVSVQADSVECCSHGNSVADPAVPWPLDGKGVLPVSRDRHVLLSEHLDSVYICICIFPT